MENRNRPITSRRARAVEIYRKGLRNIPVGGAQQAIQASRTSRGQFYTKKQLPLRLRDAALALFCLKVATFFIVQNGCQLLPHNRKRCSVVLPIIFWSFLAGGIARPTKQVETERAASGSVSVGAFGRHRAPVHKSTEARSCRASTAPSAPARRIALADGAVDARPSSYVPSIRGLPTEGTPPSRDRVIVVELDVSGFDRSPRFYDLQYLERPLTAPVGPVTYHFFER